MRLGTGSPCSWRWGLPLGRSGPRPRPDGRPAAYVTRDAGKSWQRLDHGLPQSQAWWTVKRQAMTVDALPTPALYLGTTSGELWIGHGEGARWALAARHLPEIYAVEVGTPAPGRA